MKLQIDTTKKIIKLDEKVKLSELVKVLGKLLPGEWKEYTLETRNNDYVTCWSNYSKYPYTITVSDSVLNGTCTVSPDVSSITYTDGAVTW